MHRTIRAASGPIRAGGMALYLRLSGPDGLDDAVSAGADGVSYQVELAEDAAVVGGVPLAQSLSAAAARGLRVELVAGGPHNAAAMQPVLAATVATVVSARQVTDTIVLSSFDHASVVAVGSTMPRLPIGLRHISTLHDPVGYASRAGAGALHPAVGAVSPGDIARAAANDIALHAWTITLPGWPVAEQTQFEAAMAAGLPALTVDDPGLVVRERGIA